MLKPTILQNYPREKNFAQKEIQSFYIELNNQNFLTLWRIFFSIFMMKKNLLILLLLFFLNLSLLFAQENFNNKDSYIKIIKRERIKKEERKKEYTVNLKYTPSLEKFKIFWHTGEVIDLKEDIPWKEKVKIPLEESKLTLWGEIYLGDKGIPLKVVVFFPQGFLSKNGLLAEGYKIYIDKDYDNVFEEEEGYICQNPYKVMIDDIDILHKKGRGKYKMSIQVFKTKARLLHSFLYTKIFKRILVWA